jgi:radical SAM protein with 4Fe4S-binding SPASM domain
MEEIEITTMVGCPNNCWYCPQDIFISSYKSDIKILTFDNFKLLLKNIDTKTVITFSGYSENFLNPEIVDMLIYSYKNDYKINIYTTFRGFDYNKMEKLKESGVEFNIVSFHRYNGNGYNQELFDEKMNKFLSYFKINFCRWEVDLRNNKDKTLSKNNVNIISRAGNIKNINNIRKESKIECNHYGNDLLFYKNVVVPNGDVYICCQDFGLKHKIGNLFEYHYDSNEFNNERKKIKDLFSITNSDLICRDCEFSNLI